MMIGVSIHGSVQGSTIVGTLVRAKQQIVGGVVSSKASITGIAVVSKQTLLGTVVMPGQYDEHLGAYNIVPTFEEQKLHTQSLLMRDDVTIESIPVIKIANPSGGNTVIIGG